MIPPLPTHLEVAIVPTSALLLAKATSEGVISADNPVGDGKT